MMGLIKRLYVEKKPGCDIEARHLFEEVRTNLNIANVSDLRILYRYDIEGISEEHYVLCKNTIFSELPVDILYDETFDLAEDEIAFAVEYLPGQYDQRADSAIQCMEAVTSQTHTVESAKVIILKGRLLESEILAVKQYCINPVDSREASFEKPEKLGVETFPPDSVKRLDEFIALSKEEMILFHAEFGFAMSVEDLLHCQRYFKNNEKRNPSITEIRVIDTYWSDHCRHTTFLTTIENVEFDAGYYSEIIQQSYQMYLDERKTVYKDRDKEITLMDIAVMGMKALKNKGLLDDLDESDEINACSIVVDVDVDGETEQWLVMFKNETHNHPTEIEPFGGAATCLGGAIRDPLSGRSYVYHSMRVTGGGDPRKPVSETLSGKLPGRKITTGAAHGFSSYGNQIGLATGQVTEIFDEGYVAKRMEIGAVIGAAPKSHVRREKPGVSDVVILVGGRTGRDGCGGATGSSKEHTEDSILRCGAEVQKGNPLTERKLQRLFRKPEVSALIKKCNDFGAGGVCVAIGELADGLVINLDEVLKKYDGLDGTELAISESQERMAVVVSRIDSELFIRYAQEENLEAVSVADVVDTRRLTMFWRGDKIVDISRDFLDTNGAKQKTSVAVVSPERFSKSKDDDASKWFENLQNINVAAQKGLVERFDSTIGAGTVLMPFGGKVQLTPIEVMAAKIPLEKGETNTATMMAFGYNPEVAAHSPFHGAVYAVVESVSKIVAAGGAYQTVRLTFQEYFERLGSDPLKWQKPFAALLGGFYAQMKLSVPSIGGKDSMSGTFKDISVPPTLVSFAVDVAKVGDIISPEFKKEDSTILLLQPQYDQYDLPDFDDLMKQYELIHRLIQENKIVAAHTVGVGGVAAAVAKMSFGNQIGAVIDCEDLYSPCYGAFVLEIMDVDDFAGYEYTVLGRTTLAKEFVVNGLSFAMEDSVEAWLKPLDSVFSTGYFEERKAENIEVPTYTCQTRTKAVQVVKPCVFIPVFPGTNCEVDTMRAFERAGATVKMTVVRNITPTDLKQSIEEMVKNISGAQMIAFPGGFSAGDEPEGSGKYIAAVFRNEYLKDAVHELLWKRDGLILGICNGFQALLKLGLLTTGEICDLTETSPTLTFNQIGRHISCLTTTKIVSNHSPWLWQVTPGDEHAVVVSHGEGRFMANEEQIHKLIANHQIATQYVNFASEPTYDIRHNPNGSQYAIEGITSPNGRVFGKMGHSERIGHGLYKNIPGEKDQKIFESGVAYFS